MEPLAYNMLPELGPPEQTVEVVLQATGVPPPTATLYPAEATKQVVADIVAQPVRVKTHDPGPCGTVAVVGMN